MKIKSLLGCTLLAALTLISCNNDDNVGTGTENEKIIINSDVQSLNKRINFKNSGVLDIITPSAGKNTPAQAASLPVVLVAEVTPPVYGGRTLKATHVAINGDYAYVSYNTEGEAYGGAVDVINISNPNIPQLVVQAIFPNTDVSAVSYENGKLYITGAASVDAFPNLSSPGFVSAMTLNNGLLTTNYVQTQLTGNVGTSVTSVGNKYYAVSGGAGDLVAIDKNTNQIQAAIPVADLRAVGQSSNKIVVLSGTSGIKVYDANSMAPQSSFTTSVDVPGAKRTIDFLGNNLLVSEGYAGLGVYNFSNGSKVQTIAVPTNVAGVDNADITTNAVSVNNQNVFLANGGAGLYIYKNENQALNLVGSIEMSGSCNYTMSKGDYIFAAMGNGGLKIAKMVTNTQTLNCSQFPTYNGSVWLNVNSNETKEYQGSASLMGVNVNANLTFCGSLAVSQGLNINSGGVFYMKGSLAQGQQSNPWLSLIINNNAVMRVEGDVVIYGHLILNSGSKLEFVGNNSSITIHGNVTKGNNVTITGSFTDTFNKL